MKITEKQLRSIIKERISREQPAPVEGLTGLMQEFDVPRRSRQKICNILQSVERDSGGPLDASYEVEKQVVGPVPPEEFFARAMTLMKDDPKYFHESKRILVSRNQLRLVLKEALSDSTSTVLTEEELNEIAPLIAAIAGGAARVAAGGASGAARIFSKGASGLSRALTKSPNLASTATKLLNKAKNKMPNLKRYLDELQIDLEDPNVADVSQVLRNPPDKIKNEMDKVLKSASAELKKASECDCPTLEELQAQQEQEGG